MSLLNYYPDYKAKMKRKAYYREKRFQMVSEWIDFILDEKIDAMQESPIPTFFFYNAVQNKPETDEWINTLCFYAENTIQEK